MTQEDEAHSPILEVLNTSTSNESSSTCSSTPSVSMTSVVPEEPPAEATVTSIKSKTGKTKVLGGVKFDTVPLTDDAPDSTASGEEVKPESLEQGRSGICGATFNFGKLIDCCDATD